MPTPLKPCDGQFSTDLQEILSRNRNREQWATHACELCGAMVGAVQVHGKWVPEQHWPSVTYPARTPVTTKSRRSAVPEAAPEDDAVPAGSGSH